MKKIIVAAVLVLALGACGDDDDSIPPRADTNGHRLYVETVTDEGTDYTCIVYDDDYYEQGGLWCERRDPQ